MPVIRHTMCDGEHISSEYHGGFDYSCDIIVVGLGTAGSVSAIVAAKSGKSVIGIESTVIPGGVGTAACVWDYYFGAQGGEYTEINKSAQKLLESEIYMSTEKSGFKTYPGSVKSMALEDELEKYGVQCFYSAPVTAVFTENGRICGAECFSTKPVPIRAKVIIDSAEGAVCRLLGNKPLGGRRLDNKTARFSKTVAINDGERLRGAWQQGESLSDKSAEELARIIYSYAANPPCFADSFEGTGRLYGIGAVIGKREVFCCDTEDVYTFSDYLSGKRNEQVAFYSLSQLDNSCADVWNEDDDYIDWRVLCNMKTYAFSVGISPRMLIARGYDNLLVAGKHIGTAHTLASGVRMRTDMEKCGEVAAVMASLAVKYGCTVKDVAQLHFDELLSVLERSGCYNEDNDRGICDLNVPDGGMWKTVALPTNTQELKIALDSVTPSLGLFAVRTGKIAVDETVIGWLCSKSKLLRENTAVALGLLNDRRALPILREILNGEPELYKHFWEEPCLFSWHSYTELCNYIKAACLVARFGEECDRDLMLTVSSYDGEDQNRITAAKYAKRFFE